MEVIIVGGGISGLLLASQLSSMCEKVIIFESKKNNSRAPHSKHLHVLLQKGQDIFFDFFPEYINQFRKDCPVIDWAKDTKWESIAGRFPQYRSKIITFSFSRSYLEDTLLSIVKEKKNIQLINSKVTNFIFNKKTIIGVSTNEKNYHAKRVFICAGSHFPLKRLLKDKLSYKERINYIDISYQSSISSKENFQHTNCKQYYSQLMLPHATSGLVQIPIENNQYINTEIFYRLNRDLLLPHNKFEFTKRHIFRRKMQRMKGVVVMGDSLCSLNPVYGQGMTVIFMQVKEICSHFHLTDAQLQKKMSKLSFIPWQLSNLSFQKEENFFSLYLLLFYKKCTSSKRVHLNFLNILHLNGGYYKLFHFKIFCKVIFKIIKMRRH